MQINWQNNNCFTIDNIEFVIDLSLPHERFSSSADDQKFLLVKSKPMVNFYEKLLEKQDFQRGIELGVFEGGSSLFLYKLTELERLDCIELRLNSAPELDKYLEDNSLNISLHYGVNQADANSLRKIVALDDRPIDFILDDASHFYEETKASFNLLFPYLRNGGMYVIEDWNWCHNSPHNGTKSEVWTKRKALTNLIFEMVMLNGSSGNLIESIEIFRNIVVINKSQNALHKNDFDISSSYFIGDRSFQLI